MLLFLALVRKARRNTESQQASASYIHSPCEFKEWYMQQWWVHMHCFGVSVSIRIHDHWPADMPTYNELLYILLYSEMLQQGQCWCGRIIFKAAPRVVYKPKKKKVVILSQLQRLLRAHIEESVFANKLERLGCASRPLNRSKRTLGI